MNNEIILALTDKDENKAYEYTKKICSESEHTDKYYKNIDDFVSLITNKNSYIRTRAFILCCSQSKWDTNGKIKSVLPQMLTLFHDIKPTVVRQCLNAVKEVVVYRPELAETVENELKKIYLSQYKDSMSPLIKKDMDSLTELINEVRNVK